jgi:N-ethylmaleimide reductase
MSEKLFSPFTLGTLRLPNRLVMAPMSRNRADASGAAHALTATYYAQRAGAGLIVTEAAPVSAGGRTHAGAPGLYEPAHVVGWQQVTQAVHAAGGRIFAQLWHAGAQPCTNIGEAIAQFASAAVKAKQAGFDGVEVHAANGYLIDQFLRDGVNRRSDAYGGEIENRVRLLREVLDVVTAEWPGRVGVRLSPVNPYNGMRDSAPQRTFEHVAAALGERELAYLHVDESAGDQPFDWPAFRRCYTGVYIANGGYDLRRARAAIESGYADLVSFGVPFLANPDLVERLRADAPLNAADRSTFYGGDGRGYTDYPTLGA